LQLVNASLQHPEHNTATCFTLPFFVGRLDFSDAPTEVNLRGSDVEIWLAIAMDLFN
jgi:hypothetical protein